MIFNFSQNYTIANQKHRFCTVFFALTTRSNKSIGEKKILSIIIEVIPMTQPQCFFVQFTIPTILSTTFYNHKTGQEIGFVKKKTPMIKLFFFFVYFYKKISYFLQLSNHQLNVIQNHCFFFFFFQL